MSRDSRFSSQGDGQRSGEITAEQLQIRSGQLVIIDQFMLVNRQFTAPCSEMLCEYQDVQQTSSSEKLQHIIQSFGGAILPLANGEYSVFREPRMQAMMVLSERQCSAVGSDRRRIDPRVFAEIYERRGDSRLLGRVFIDTRCVVFLDALLLNDAAVLEEFSLLRQSGNDKGGRDLLRARGAAVRYGFDERSDELRIVEMPDGVIMLSPAEK